jgi:hypothetical protein
MNDPQEKTKRGLRKEFLDDLKIGFLKPLLSLVKADDTLMLAIRKNYINIYYRGGNILKLTWGKGHQYKAEFDQNYAKAENWPPEAKEIIITKNEICKLPPTIKADKEVQQWLAAFPTLKQIMDIWLAKNMKSEREFQQLVVRENNFSRLADKTDYFIVDIEVIAYPDIEAPDHPVSPVRGHYARFDLLAVKCPCPEEMSNSEKIELSLAFIEMKYDDESLTNLTAHLKDVKDVINSKGGQFREMCNTITQQLNQFNELGLLKKPTLPPKRTFEIKNDKPEVILLLVGCPPQSTNLRNLFKNEKDKLEGYAQEASFALKFHLPHSAGYGLFRNDITSFDKFKAQMFSEKPSKP